MQILPRRGAQAGRQTDDHGLCRRSEGGSLRVFLSNPGGLNGANHLEQSLRVILIGHKSWLAVQLYRVMFLFISSTGVQLQSVLCGRRVCLMPVGDQDVALRYG